MDSRVLVVSNEALSEQSSNGRTLLNFLKWIPAENIAQFCLRGIPDSKVCAKFYKVTDREARDAFLMRTSQKAESLTESVAAEKRTVKRNCGNLLLRDCVWRTYRWWKEDFTRFLQDFDPAVVLFQAGDAPFMFEIAMRIARQFSIPIIMYNSENYVLKHKMFSSANPKSVWHWLLKRNLKHAYKRMMDRVSHCIYSTEYLENCYQQAYPHPKKSTTFYTVSEMEPLADDKESEGFSLLYCGNLGVGRVEPLCQIAQVLYQIDPKAKLKIYGNFPKEEEKEELCAMPNVKYHGIVPYSQISQLMKKASMVIHCENAERLENLKGAFSTKIADSLACGRPFLVYAIREYPFVQYLIKNDCAHIAGSATELEDILRQCMDDKQYRHQYVNRAIETAQKNHSADSSCEKMAAILAQVEKKQ